MEDCPLSVFNSEKHIIRYGAEMSTDSRSFSSLFFHPRIQLAAIILFGIFILFTKLDKGELAGLDDCYYAQKTKEMLATGDWMTMHFGGREFFDNPPFFMWLQAILFKPFGANEYTARFWSAFLGLCTILLVYHLGKLWYNHQVGTYAAVIMLTTQYFLKYARRGMMDVTLTFLVVLALFCFWKSFEKKRYLFGFGLSTAAAILTKSILGLFPILIVGCCLLVSRQWRRVFSMQYILGSAIALSVGSTWFIHQYIVNGDVFVEQHFGVLIVARALQAGGEHQPLYSYFWYVWKLFEHYLPWVFFAVCGCWIIIRRNIQPRVLGAEKQPYHPDILVLCWIGVVIGMMSFAYQKKVWYIMSAFPALALVSAAAVERLLSTDRLRLRFYQTAFGFLLLAAVVFAATPVRLDTNRHSDLKAIAHYVKNTTPEVQYIINYRIAYWINRSVLLFYGDVDLSPTVENTASLKQNISRDTYTPLLTKDTVFSDLSNDQELDVRIIMKSRTFIYCNVRTKEHE